MDIGIVDLLTLAGFDQQAKAKMVRHQDARYPVMDLLRNHWLDVYQGYQSRPVFHDWVYVVSFYGIGGTRACFYGVFQNRGFFPVLSGPVLEFFPWVDEWRQRCQYYYDLERVTGFEHLEHRAIVDWGPAAIAWHQKLTNKPVIELMPRGRKLPPFDDYLEFSLSYEELQELFANPDAHREWRANLEAVGGVYLILAEPSGDLYVGSASGTGGIWARWEEYAQTGHGGNHLLRSLVENEPENYPRCFRFSLLQILPKTTKKEEVLRHEAIFKDKLGTRATGLNLN